MVVLLGAMSAHAENPRKSPDDAYLDNLQGSWLMQGTLGGKPVRYLADGQRVLNGGFLKLHMVDVGTPPQYEALLFIGFDPKAADFVAHWLDQFGAAGARVVATGTREGQRLVLHFPYAEGAFRDTFLWQPASSSWTLLLESQRADGSWTTFASYTLARRNVR
jgi:hypothetical protein